MLVSVRVFHLARYESYETKYPSTNLSWGSIVFWTPKNIPFQTPFTSGGTTGCLSRRRGPPARYKIVKITPGARTPPTPKPMKNHGLVKWDFPLKSTKIVGFGGIHRDFSEGAGGSIPPHADLLFEVGGRWSQVTVKQKRGVYKPVASRGLVYLPTFSLYIYMVNVGRYTIDGCYGYKQTKPTKSSSKC